MAPNIRQLTLVSDDALADVSNLVRSKVTVTSPRDEEQSASYWDWPADEGCVDLFSVDRLQANLIKDAAASRHEDTALIAEHDDYWAESSAPLHQQGGTSVVETAQDEDYWCEANHEDSLADAYWNRPSSGRHCNGPFSADYWDEVNHARTASDRYWNDNYSRADEYWHEASHVRTDADLYWSMVSRGNAYA